MVVCARPDCRQIFYLCPRCDRGDRYCSRACAHRARRATLHAAGRRYQAKRPGRLRHAARQAHYRTRHKNVTHQTSPAAPPPGIVTLPPPSGGQEDVHDATLDPLAQGTGPRCARCGRRGRFVRSVTLAHLRPPRPTLRR